MHIGTISFHFIASMNWLWKMFLTIPVKDEWWHSRIQLTRQKSREIGIAMTIRHAPAWAHKLCPSIHERPSSTRLECTFSLGNQSTSFCDWPCFTRNIQIFFDEPIFGRKESSKLITAGCWSQASPGGWQPSVSFEIPRICIGEKTLSPWWSTFPGGGAPLPWLVVRTHEELDFVFPNFFPGGVGLPLTCSLPMPACKSFCAKLLEEPEG